MADGKAIEKTSRVESEERRSQEKVSMVKYSGWEGKERTLALVCNRDHTIPCAPTNARRRPSNLLTRSKRRKSDAATGLASSHDGLRLSCS